MFSILDGREKFYQWDSNRQLIVNDETILEVHFANCFCSDARVCEVSDGVVNVPNDLLTEYMDIRVWAYDGEMTKYEQVFEVVKRTKPSDYVYTETEVKRYEDFEERIAALEAGGGADLSEYAKKEYVDEAIVDFQTAEQVQTLIDEALGVIENGTY